MFVFLELDFSHTYHRACLINLRVFFKTYILLQNDSNIKLCDILKKKMSHAKTNLTAAPWCVSMTASKKIIRNMFSNHFSLSTLTNNNCSVDVCISII